MYIHASNRNTERQEAGAHNKQKDQEQPERVT